MIKRNSQEVGSAPINSHADVSISVLEESRIRIERIILTISGIRHELETGEAESVLSLLRLAVRRVKTLEALPSKSKTLNFGGPN